MKIKILHFIYGLHIGGAETFLRNLITCFQDNDKYEFSFIIQDAIITNEFFLKLKIKYGNKRFVTIPSFPFNCFAQYRALKNILSHSDYDAIHIHMNSFVNPIPVIVATKKGLPIIIHSHSTSNFKGGVLGGLVHKLNRKLFNNNKFIALACSDSSGKWMFKNKEFTVVYNSINIEKFRYSSTERNLIRKKLSIPDLSYVIGIVGRLHPQKNHKRAFEIFKQFNEKYNNSVLLVVGDGPIKTELLDYAKSKMILDKIIFMGALQETAPVYSAIDVLLFPSFYEGLGIVGIEAQAAGLGVVASDSICKEMDVSGSVDFISLNADNKVWTDHLFDKIKKNSEKSRLQNNLKLRGGSYSLNSLFNKMSNLYNNVQSLIR